MDALPFTGEEFGVLALATGIWSWLLDELKPYLEGLPGFRGERKPWPLLVKAGDIGAAFYLWVMGYLPSADNGLEVLTAGIVGAYGAQKVYDVRKQPKPEPPHYEPIAVEEPLPNLLENNGVSRDS